MLVMNDVHTVGDNLEKHPAFSREDLRCRRIRQTVRVACNLTFSEHRTGTCQPGRQRCHWNYEDVALTHDIRLRFSPEEVLEHGR